MWIAVVLGVLALLCWYIIPLVLEYLAEKKEEDEKNGRKDK